MEKAVAKAEKAPEKIVTLTVEDLEILDYVLDITYDVKAVVTIQALIGRLPLILK